MNFLNKNKYKDLIKSFYYFFTDYIYFFTIHKGNKRNSFNEFLGIYKLRLFLFRLPVFIYRKRKKRYILKKYKIDHSTGKEFEFFNEQLIFNEKFREKLNHILDNQIGQNNSASSFSKGGIDSININKESYKAIYINVTSFITNNLEEVFSNINLNEFLEKCSYLLGYKVFLSDLDFAVSKTCGENSNSYWHSDAFFPIVKGFIYLVDISRKDSPFEFAKGSTQLSFIQDTYDKWFNQHNYMTGSPRIICRDTLNLLEQNKISFTGKVGYMTIVNSSGYHRKGKDLSGLERRMLNFEFKRLNLLSRLIRSVL